jgi:hypothetical protein
METNVDDPLAETDKEETEMSSTPPPGPQKETKGQVADQTESAGTHCPRYLLFPLTVVLIVAMLLAGAKAHATTTAWWIIAISMVVFVAVLGGCINGRILGILITERNIMSLSRLQVVIWTIIVLSAFLAIALKRMFYLGMPIEGALAINLPWQLWALMGISTTSLIGSPLISTNRETNLRRSDPDRGTKRPGARISRTNVGDAEFADIFRGDEDGNRNSIDVAKVQMFFFTIISALAYAVLLGNWMVGKTPDALSSFPVLPEGLLALLGISHAGYLSGKGINHSGPQ